MQRKFLARLTRALDTLLQEILTKNATARMTFGYFLVADFTLCASLNNLYTLSVQFGLKF